MSWKTEKVIAALLLAFIAFGASAVVGAEGKPEIITQVEPEDIFLGESANYWVRVNNVPSVENKADPVPDMSAFNADFTVHSLGDRTENQSTINVVNGQMYQRTVFSHIYQFQLTPKTAGRLTLPGPFVMTEGQKITGKPAELRVRAQEKQDAVIVEIALGKPRVYVTQPFDVTLRILVRPMPGGETRDPLSLVPPVDLNINWLKTPEGLTAPEMSQWLNTFLVRTGHGFTLNNLAVQEDIFSRENAVLSLYTGREKRKGLDGETIEYFVYELKRTFTPQKTGTFVFGPATLKGTFIDGQTGKKYTTRRLVVITPAANLEVRDVPTPAPPTFCGGIGAYSITTSAAPMALRVGDPTSLKINFERQRNSGGLDLISAPDIAANPQLAADFEIIDKAPIGQVSGETKTFSYGLRPKRAGVSIPPLKVSLFDVDSEKFNEITTEPIALTVTQAAHVDAGDLVASPTTTKTATIRNQQGGFFQNFQDMSALQDQRISPVGWGAGALAAWIGCGIASLLVVQQRRRANDATWQRRQRARPDAEQRIAEGRAALKNGDSAGAVRAARAAIAGMIGDMLGIPAAGMTAHDASVALRKTPAPEALQKRAVGLLESIEALEYAPSSGQDVAGFLDTAAALAPELSRELSK